jgi:hypothetical protein
MLQMRGMSTNSNTRNAGLEPIQQRRYANVRVQNIVYALLRLRVLS